MENLSNILDDNLVYFILIGVLVLLIIIVIISILKDKKKTPVVDNKEKELAKLELEKVVKQMEENKDEVSTTYEEEQEDNAIISYQELLSKVKGNYEKKEVDFNSIKNNYIDELDIINEVKKDIYNPISKEVESVDSATNKIEEKLSREKKYETNDYDVRELFDNKSVLNVDNVKTSVNIEIPNKDTKFKNSEFISPIHGLKEYDGEYFKQHENNGEIKHDVKQKEVEVIDLATNELDFNEFSDKIKNTNDFLGTLKDLRSKL